MARVHDLGRTSTASGDLSGLAALYRWPISDTPFVRSDFVATIDGRAQGPDERTDSINTDADHLVFDTLRALADVVVVGAGTVRQEGYRAIALSEAQRAVRIAHGLPETPPALLVLSSSLNLPEAVAASGHSPEAVHVLGSHDAATQAVQRLRAAGATVHLGNARYASPAEVLELCRSLGWHRILLEGGPTIHHQWLAAGAVDEICLSLAPAVVGGDRLSVVSGSMMQPPAEFAVAAVVVLDDTIMVRWRRTAAPPPDASRS